MRQTKSNQPHFSDVQYVHKVTLGSIDPQMPFSEEQHSMQLAKLNRCLNDRPKGVILGRDISVATYQMGEHQFTMQTTTYHVGFERSPHWIDEKPKL